MRKPLILFIVVAACVVPVWASNPGEPLDCSDWVFLEPGLSCQMIIPNCGDLPQPEQVWCSIGDVPIDNEGGILRVRMVPQDPVIVCSATGTTVVADQRVEIASFDGTNEKIIAYIDERCGTQDSVDQMFGGNLNFDEENGRLYFKLQSSCDSSFPQGICNYSVVDWVGAIDGFTTTFEILQTYTPTSGPISFRVPYLPEGFSAADYFDTYAGTLASVGDWNKARPVQCGYPASPPSVGDYLIVEDDLPPLQSGRGRYYVTAVTHQGEIRYGRKSSGGVLTGRDPAVLPGCAE